MFIICNIFITRGVFIVKIKYTGVANPYNLEEFEFLGQGHNGTVYLMPDGRAIKISNNDKDFQGEHRILTKVYGNKYFPILYEVGEDYMIREEVKGVMLSDYLKKHKLTTSLAQKVIDLIVEFEKLNFSKIDIRCKDIFIQPDGELKIIDPKLCYTIKRNYPKNLSKGLYEADYLNKFLKVLKVYDPRHYEIWKTTN